MAAELKADTSPTVHEIKSVKINGYVYMELVTEGMAQNMQELCRQGRQQEYKMLDDDRLAIFDGMNRYNIQSLSDWQEEPEETEPYFSRNQLNKRIFMQCWRKVVYHEYT